LGRFDRIPQAQVALGSEWLGYFLDA